MATTNTESPRDPRSLQAAADFLRGAIAGMHLADTEEKPTDSDPETEEEGESCFAGTIPDQTDNC